MKVETKRLVMQGSWLLVDPDPETEQKRGNIIIPNVGYGGAMGDPGGGPDSYQSGVILEAGPGYIQTDGSTVPTGFEVGERIRFHRNGVIFMTLDGKPGVGLKEYVCVVAAQNVICKEAADEVVVYERQDWPDPSRDADDPEVVKTQPRANIE